MHVKLDDQSKQDLGHIVKVMNDCFHSYGIHSATIQPELVMEARSEPSDKQVQQSKVWSEACEIKCGSSCQVLACCG